MVFCREHGSDHEIKVAPRVTLVLDRIKILSKTSFFMSCLYLRYSAQLKRENCAVRATAGRPAAVQFYREMAAKSGRRREYEYNRR